MSLTHDCPLCGEGTLEPRTYGRDMEHKGVMLSVEGLQYDFCPVCEAETTTPEQMDHNAALIRTAYIAERARVKAEQGLLTGTEIRAIRESLGVTQKQAAKIFGGGPTAFSKYEAEDVVQSVAMDKLLRVAAEVPMAAQWLVERAGETLRKAVAITSEKFEVIEKTPWNSAAIGQFNAPMAMSNWAAFFPNNMEENLAMKISDLSFPDTSTDSSNDERFASAA